MNIKRYFLLITFLLTIPFFTNASSDEIKKEQIESARYLLLKTARNISDLFYVNRKIENSIDYLHNPKISTTSNLNLKKLLTKGDWNRIEKTKNVEVKFDEQFVELLKQCDFVILNNIDNDKFEKELILVLQFLQNFCTQTEISHNLETQKDESSTALLEKLKNYALTIETESQKRTKSTFDKLTGYFWGTPFSYEVLPIFINLATPLTNFLMQAYLAHKFTNETDPAKIALAHDKIMSEMKASTKFFLGTSKASFFTGVIAFFSGIYKSLQYEDYELYKRDVMYEQDQKRNSFQKSVEKQITFNDIIGCEKEKESLQHLIESLKNPLKFKRFNVSAPKGILLTGKPGTGKTMFARAIAGEAKCSCWVVCASELIGDKFITSETKIKSIFDKAEASAPAILFIDELDFIGSKRNHDDSNNSKSQALASLLTKLSGFKPRNPYKPILLIAATSSYDDLDEALVRSGRFDIQIDMKNPNEKTRKNYLEKEINKIKTSFESVNIDFEALIKMTEGLSFADLTTFCNNTQSKAIFSNTKQLTTEHFKEALLDLKK